MHQSVKNLISIKKELESISNKLPSIIAVSKTFSISTILPLIDYGHVHFGENKVQEALEKWTDVKLRNEKIKLHFIGKLQSNKVKFAVKLFDYIHSLDNEKLAKKISEEQKKINKSLKLFIQINIGSEEQKSGISINEVDNFIKICKELNLNVVGTMCLPPDDGKQREYFSIMEKINNKYFFNELSMGMSNDYLDAVEFRSSFLRVGSKIFGQRS
mgnify:CR=1 FL=1